MPVVVQTERNEEPTSRKSPKSPSLQSPSKEGMLQVINLKYSMQNKKMSTLRKGTIFEKFENIEKPVMRNQKFEEPRDTINKIFLNADLNSIDKESVLSTVLMNKMERHQEEYD